MSVKIPNETKSKAEALMMGLVVSVSCDLEVEQIQGYVHDTLAASMIDTHCSGGQLIEEAYKYVKGTDCIKYLSLNNTPYGMMLTCAMCTDEDNEDTWCLDDPYGVMSYVRNYDDPMCSELGYVFFRKTDTRYIKL